MIWHGFHDTARPGGVPLEDWWNIGYRAAWARETGILDPQAASQVMWGLPEVLRLQAKRMERPFE